MLYFVFFRSVREKLQSTVSLDHPVPLILFSQVRLCWRGSGRPPSPSRELSPSHLDLDNDAIDYDLACHQLQPLPPPKLMVMI